MDSYYMEFPLDPPSGDTDAGVVKECFLKMSGVYGLNYSIEDTDRVYRDPHHSRVSLRVSDHNKEIFSGMAIIRRLEDDRADWVCIADCFVDL